MIKKKNPKGKKISRYRLKCASSVCLLLLSVATDILYLYFMPLVKKFLNIQDESIMYLIVSASILMIFLVTSFQTFKSAVISLSRLKFDSSVFILFVFTLNICQIAAYTFMLLYQNRHYTSVYTSSIAIFIVMDDFSRYFNEKRVYQNQRLVSKMSSFATCELFPDEKLILDVLNQKYKKNSQVAYSKKIHKVSGVARLSWADSPALQLLQRAVPVIIFLSVIAAISSAVVSRDFLISTTSALIFALISSPCFIYMSSSILLNRMSKRMKKRGVMICGNAGLKKFKNTRGIMVNANQLYPNNQIIVHGIKTFKGNRIDEALPAISALLEKVNGPLKNVFGKIIKCQKTIIPEVSNVVYEDGKGVIGWVGGKRILAGNRELLKKYSISPPVRAIEKKYIDNGNQITYFALGGQLVAMLILTYTPNQELISQLNQLSKNSMSLIVTTVDSNITPELISRDFNVPFKLIKILTSEQSKHVNEEIEDQETQDGYVVYESENQPIITVIGECKSTYSKLVSSFILQVASMIIGLSVATFLICCSTCAHIGSLEVFLYVAFWSIIGFVVPSLV